MSKCTGLVEAVGEIVPAIGLHTDALGNISVHTLSDYTDSCVYEMIGQIGKGLSYDDITLIYNTLSGIVYEYNLDTKQVFPFLTPNGGYYRYNENKCRLEPVNGHMITL